MSITKPIIVYGLLPSLHIKSSSQTRFLSSSSSKIVCIKHYHGQGLFSSNIRRGLKDNVVNTRKSFVCNVAPGTPPPSEPPFNFINWIVGVVMTVVVPFFSHKWYSLSKIKNDLDNAVDTIEDIVDAVEKVADKVEKIAEDIADDLPEGGRLRRAVDFVEHVAERASHDADLIGDLIDRAQEAEDKAEAYVESLVHLEKSIHEHAKENDKAHDDNIKKQLEVVEEVNTTKI